jgi:2-oxoglutarate dehydrogenase E2 component (dihydrolipoamide succinyltransferase)
MATDVQVPALGESITEGTLAQWLKKPGEAVKADEPIASLETDKVSVEVPSPVAGVLTEQLVEEGDNVAVGAVIARIDQSATAAAAPSPAAAGAESTTTNPAGAGENPQLRGTPHAPEPIPGEDGGETSVSDEDHITTLSPAVRRAVLEYHVDPTKIKGTGKDGRLTKDDVIAAAEAQKQNTPAQAGAQAPQAKAPAPEAKAPPPGPRPSPGNAGERKESHGGSRKRKTPRPC